MSQGNSGDGDSNHDFSRRDVLKGTGGAIAISAIPGTAMAGQGNERKVFNVGFENVRGKAATERAATSIEREFGFDAMTIEATQQAADGLENDPNIRYVEEDGEMWALDQTTPYGIEITDADVAIDDGNTGDGTHVAIIDTGIDAQHETLEENLGEGHAVDGYECDADAGGCMFGGGNDISQCYEEWDDDNDHGSHCAGTAAAADNGVGVLGVAPDTTLHAVKVLDNCGSGSYSSIAAGIEWAAEQGHDVLSMSLGGDCCSDAIEDAIDYAVSQNCVLVAAAGNDGECTDCVGYPASHEEVIAVSATDEDDELADFSSTGPEVELAAPGVDTLSTVPRDDYAEFSGTSMACPHVSGAAATVIADGTTDREDVRQQLKDAADDIGLDDNEQGAGRLNVADAVDAESDDDDEEEEEEENVSVTTDSATDVTETSATLNGELTELSGADSADVYFEYGESGSNLSNTTATQTLSSTGVFDDTVDGLDAGTEYEFRAVAETTDASDTGSVVAFTTDDDEEEEENTAPVIDSWDVSTGTSGPWFRVESVWSVSDDDGNLDTVTTELLDGGTVVADETSFVSGSSASGEHEVRTRGDADEVRLVVTDEEGETTTDTEAV